MQTIRMIVRTVLGFSWLFFMWAVRLSVSPVRRFDERLERRLRRACTRTWAAGMGIIMGMRLEVHGEAPRAPFFLVSNHLSYVDIFILQRMTGCTFVARSEMAQMPLFGWLGHHMQVVYVDRERRGDASRANDAIRDALEKGDAMAVFAESRITRGRAVDPFRSALIEPAVALDIPVHYVALSYKTTPPQPPASQVVGWWQPEPFLHHFARMFKERGFTAVVRFGAAPLRGTDRKQLARDLTEAVRAHFTPVL